MGKSPHRGGAGPLFPGACSGIPGEGHGQDMADREKRARRPESAATHGGYFGMRGGSGQGVWSALFRAAGSRVGTGERPSGLKA